MSRATIVAEGEAFAHVMDCWQTTLRASERMGSPAQVLLRVKPSVWNRRFSEGFGGVSLQQSRHTVIAGVAMRSGSVRKRSDRNGRLDLISQAGGT
jgi:hypothetical protein